MVAGSIRGGVLRWLVSTPGIPTTTGSSTQLSSRGGRPGPSAGSVPTGSPWTRFTP